MRFARAHELASSLLVLVMVLALWGCSTGELPSPTEVTRPAAETETPSEAAQEPAATDTAPPPPTSTLTPSPRSPAAPVFEAAPCPFVAPSSAAIDCGYVVVPADHARPGDRELILSVVVFRDGSADHQPDPLVLLAGGPGEKVAGRAVDVAQFVAAFAPNRDIVIYDQRGVGSSEPALECPEVLDAAFDMLDETDPTVALKGQYEAVIACRDRLVAEGYDLSLYTTAQSASDVAAIARALGYEQVNLYGGSYGSFLAQAAMRQSPDVIRSVVLESVWPLDVSFVVEYPAKTARTTLRLLADCAADDACSNAYPAIESTLYEVIDRLNSEPVPITVTNPLSGESYPAVLTGDGVYGILVSTFYQTRLLPALPQAIYDVHSGDYTLMTQLSGARLLLFDLVTRGMQYSVLCSEDLAGRSSDEYLEQVETLPEPLRGRADPEQAIQYGIFGICEEWPVVEAHASFKEPLVSDIPTLIVTGEYDGITPPEYARRVAEGLTNGHLVEVPGAGHDGEMVSGCVQGIVTAFVEDPSAELDISCVEAIPPLVFDVPSEPDAVVLVSWTNEGLGLVGVVPSGWQEVQPGILVRGRSALDPVAMQLASAPGNPDGILAAIAGQLGLDAEPEVVSQREVNDLAWSLYELEVGHVYRYLALAVSDGTTLMVIVRYDVDEAGTIYAEVFIPVLEALTLRR